MCFMNSIILSIKHEQILRLKRKRENLSNYSDPYKLVIKNKHQTGAEEERIKDQVLFDKQQNKDDDDAIGDTGEVREKSREKDVESKTYDSRETIENIYANNEDQHTANDDDFLKNNIAINEMRNNNQSKQD